MDEFLTTQQLVETLGVSRVTIQNWRKAGLPFIRISPRIFRYRLEELENWFGAEIPELLRALYTKKNYKS